MLTEPLLVKQRGANTPWEVEQWKKRKLLKITK